MNEILFTILTIVICYIMTMLLIFIMFKLEQNKDNVFFDEFAKFLRQEHCKKAFAHYVEDAVKTKYNTIKKYQRLQKDENIHLIINFFNWSDTEEGYMYWWDIDNKWNKRLKELKKQYQHVH